MILKILTLSVLPSIIYILMIYITVPHKILKLSTTFQYFIVGFLSVGVLWYIWSIFPITTELAETMVDKYSNPFIFHHYMYFIQVAFLEEISKLFIYIIISNYKRINNKKIQHPIEIMVNMGVISLGFSTIENIQYGIMYGADVLYLRSITAVVAHMLFGLFMGYWIAIGGFFNNETLFDITINKVRFLRKIIYTIFGLISATILHGIYDLHLKFNGQKGITTLYILIVFSIFIIYWCFKHLNRLNNER